MIEIRKVACHSEFDAVSRFRYSIYVEEMNRRQKHADHDRRVIVDPLQGETAKLYAAWELGEVVGTVRSNYLSCSNIGEYSEYYALGGLPSDELGVSSITTRLMVHRRHRRSTLAARLACETYRQGLEDGIATDFIDCNAHLVPYFSGLGYLIHRNHLRHPEYGDVTVMRLNLTDFDHLRLVRSPFRKVLCDRRSLLR